MLFWQKAITHNKMCELVQATKQNISQHIPNVTNAVGLPADSVGKDLFTTGAARNLQWKIETKKVTK
jgi:hypothetical protein